MTRSMVGRLEATRLVAALRAGHAADPGAQLLGASVAPIGIGALADTVRVELTWSQPSAGPTSLVAKMPSLDEAAAATAASLGAYEREALFYADLAPRTSIRVPRLLGVLLEEGVPSTVLLEDLSADYQPRDQLSELPLPVLRQARHELVLLQAPYWEDERAAGLGWLHRRLGAPIPHIIERMARSWSAARDGIGSSLAADERACVDRFVDQAEGWAMGMGGPSSLVHHDYRVDNMLFGRGEVVVLDWQTVGWGQVMFDVAYLLGTSLDPHRRRAIERDEIQRHVDELAEEGIHWDKGEAWNAYRQAAFAVLLMLVPPIATVKTNRRMEQMYCRLLSFGARMALDLDAFEFTRG